MISFRNHVVTLLAVFLALAAGIVLGRRTALRGRAQPTDLGRHARQERDGRRRGLR